MGFWDIIFKGKKVFSEPEHGSQHVEAQPPIIDADAAAGQSAPTSSAIEPSWQVVEPVNTTKAKRKAVKPASKVVQEHRMHGQAPSHVAELEVEGQKYLLSRFELGFGQRVDEKNRPCGVVEGGMITLTTQDSLAARLSSWVMSSVVKKDGQIKLFANETDLSAGAVQVIRFHGACCLELKRRRAEDGSVATTLLLSPESVWIDAEEFEVRK